MELTRRDALAALAGAGVLGGGGAAVLSRDRRDATASPQRDANADTEPRSGTETDAPATVRTDAVLDALVATATVVYPSVVENVDEFVRAYGRGKLENRPEFARGADDALDSLDGQAELSFDDAFADLDATGREFVLRRLGADSADPDPDPDGGVPGRVRYHYVNEVLFALYSSPTGGELVGIENPQGHPGGTESYRRGQPGGTDASRGETDGGGAER